MQNTDSIIGDTTIKCSLKEMVEFTSNTTVDLKALILLRENEVFRKQMFVLKPEFTDDGIQIVCPSCTESTLIVKGGDAYQCFENKSDIVWKCDCGEQRLLILEWERAKKKASKESNSLFDLIKYYYNLITRSFFKRNHIGQ